MDWGSDWKWIDSLVCGNSADDSGLQVAMPALGLFSVYDAHSHRVQTVVIAPLTLFIHYKTDNVLISGTETLLHLFYGPNHSHC